MYDMKRKSNNPNGRPRKTDCRQLVSFRLHPDTLARWPRWRSQGTTIVKTDKKISKNLTKGK